MVEQIPSWALGPGRRWDPCLTEVATEAEVAGVAVREAEAADLVPDQ